MFVGAFRCCDGVRRWYCGGQCHGWGSLLKAPSGFLSFARAAALQGPFPSSSSRGVMCCSLLLRQRPFFDGGWSCQRRVWQSGPFSSFTALHLRERSKPGGPRPAALRPSGARSRGQSLASARERGPPEGREPPIPHTSASATFKKMSASEG